MATAHQRRNRAEQRRRSEERILAAARHTFAERGFERTTIRAVAAAAGVNAGLVMHYFGSKDRLFALAIAPSAEETHADSAEDVRAETSEEVAESLLTSLAARLTGEPVASLALLRSMLTNPDAAERYRTAAEPQLHQIAAGISTPDAQLRAGLLSAIVHGIIIERHLLGLSRLDQASPEQIVELLRPCFQTLAAAGTTTPPATDRSGSEQ